ncbi:MAG: SGNH/GDSL hydrolase family protein [Leptospira sp.]|nr:SGNH/GDSL hydrolase family protein [Leptospira sp.]
MTIKYIQVKGILLLCAIFFSVNLYADKDAVSGRVCNTSEFDPNKTFLTFYGDSLGDQVDLGAYGYFGWEFYLITQKPEIDWNVQNLAVSGDTTNNTYDLIKFCTGPDKRANFRTADNVAIEIGGNNYRDNSVMLTYMPWKMGDVEERVTYNTRAIIRMLRNPLRNKKVLVMGNFPAMAKSPSLGDVGDYFKWFQYSPDGQIVVHNSEINKARLETQFGNGLVDLLKNIVVNINQIYNDFLTVLFKDWADEALLKLKSQADFTDIHTPTGQDDWYWKWIRDATKNKITHVASIGLMYHQGPLQAMANEENNYEHTFVYHDPAGHKQDVSVQYTKGGVDFLPLYMHFNFYPDSLAGFPYVANPILYSDPVHVNHFGYFYWAFHLAPKIESLGWQNMPATANYNGENCRVWNCGKAQDPPYGAEIIDEIKPEPVVPPPNPIDWLLLFCLFFGKCW